jgi:hypothetical protein
VLFTVLWLFSRKPRPVEGFKPYTLEEYVAASRWTRIKYRVYRNPAIMFLLGPLWLADRALPAVFAGTGVWVDIYDQIIRDPEFVVGEAADHGIDVIYVETSNYRSPADVMVPAEIREMIRLARPLGIRVVTWYLPGYRNIPLDRRRFQAAVNVGGAALPIDGLGVDIEADIVRNRQLRSDRAAAMVRWLRATYPDLPMAGIVPRDALAWWRIFPYKAIRASTDVMMPMCYTSRYLTAAQTRRMAANCSVWRLSRLYDAATVVAMPTSLGRSACRSVRIDKAPR